MRRDLDMPPGKLASQAAHAMSQSLINYLLLRPQSAQTFADRGDSGTRIVLGARSEIQILSTYEQALSAGLPCALFYDSGHILEPHFDGSRILTGLGLGPATREELRPLTRRFALI